MSAAIRPGALAVITGAACGIGEALAARAHETGMRLLLSDIDEAKLADVAQRFDGDYLVCDVSDPEAVRALAERASVAGQPIGAVFANAGVMKSAPLVKTTPADWAFMVGVNLMGTANMIRSFVPRLVQQTSPSRFVATASVAGLVSAPLTGAYNATKHAVVSLCETLFQELEGRSPQVGVSVVCPGAVQTDILNLEKYGQGEPESAATEKLAKLMAEKGLTAQAVAAHTFAEIQNGKFWIFPQSYVFDRLEARHRAILEGYRTEWLPKSKVVD